VGRPKLIKVDVTDGRGLGGAKNKTVSVQTRIPDILAFRDTPGFAYLLLAANPDASVSVLRRVLSSRYRSSSPSSQPCGGGAGRRILRAEWFESVGVLPSA
jgi:hypothetical protein